METFLRQLGELLASDRQEQAIALVESREESDPAYFEIGQAALAVHRGDAHACRRHAEKACTAEQDDPMPLHYLALSAIMLGSTQLAEEYARSAVQRGGSVRSRLFLGNLLLAKGQAKEADAIFCKLLARDENNLEALRSLALARYQQGAPMNALNLLTRAYERSPGQAAIVKTMLGMLTRMSGMDDIARDTKDVSAHGLR